MIKNFRIKRNYAKSKIEMTVIKGSGIKSKHFYICFPQTDERPFFIVGLAVYLSIISPPIKPEPPIY